MMEQLAERRMQREEDTQYGIAAAHQSLHGGHNHGPLDDDDYDDEEDEDYDSQEEEDYEDDEMVGPGFPPAYRCMPDGAQAYMVTGRDDGGTAHGGRAADVSDLCGSNVRTARLNGVPGKGG